MADDLKNELGGGNDGAGNGNGGANDDSNELSNLNKVTHKNIWNK